MENQEYRKLHTYLPRQPIVNQRPWLIVGLLLAFIVLFVAAYGYFIQIKKAPSYEVIRGGKR